MLCHVHGPLELVGRAYDAQLPLELLVLVDLPSLAAFIGMSVLFGANALSQYAVSWLFAVGLLIAGTLQWWLLGALLSGYRGRPRND